jgi:hypothetical protein
MNVITIIITIIHHSGTNSEVTQLITRQPVQHDIRYNTTRQSLHTYNRMADSIDFPPDDDIRLVKLILAAGAGTPYTIHPTHPPAEQIRRLVNFIKRKCTADMSPRDSCRYTHSLVLILHKDCTITNYDRRR